MLFVGGDRRQVKARQSQRPDIGGLSLATASKISFVDDLYQIFTVLTVDMNCKIKSTLQGGIRE
jgi:hypothetical protein